MRIRCGFFSAVAALAVAALTGCGGGGSTPAATPIPPPAAPTVATAPMSNGSVSIVIPHAPTASSTSRRPDYISSASQFVTIVPPAGTAPTTASIASGSPNCTTATNGDRTCTIVFAAPNGPSEPFLVTTSATSGGPPLSALAFTATIVSGQNNLIRVILGGVVASLSVSLAPTSATTGAASMSQVLVNAIDPSGEMIAGPYVNAAGMPLTIALTSSDPANAPVSRASVTASGASVTLAYTGAAVANPVVTASVAGSASATATLSLGATIAGCPPSPPANPGLFLLYNGATTAVALGATGTLIDPHLFLPLSFNAYTEIAVNDRGAIFLSANESFVSIYCPGLNSFSKPIGGITVANSSTSEVSGLTFDSGSNLYASVVPSFGSNSTAVSVDSYTPAQYAAPVQNTATVPTSVLAGAATNLVAPGSLAAFGSLLYVRDRNDVKAYPASLGNVAPTETLSSLAAGLTNPVGITEDPTGNVYVLYAHDFRTQGTGGYAIARYAAGSTAVSNIITTGLGTIRGAAATPVALVADGFGNIFVAQRTNGNGPVADAVVSEYAGATNAAPLASFDTAGTIAGTSVAITPSDISALGIDATGTIYVASPGAVVAYQSVAGAPYVPTRRIGGDSGTNSQISLVVNATVSPNGTIFVEDDNASFQVKIYEYAPGADCVPPPIPGSPVPASCAPVTTIPKSPLGSLASDATGNLYVLDPQFGSNSAPVVLVYAPTATTPTRTLTDAFATETFPEHLTANPAGDLALTGKYLEGALVYPAGANGTVTAARQLTSLSPATRSLSDPTYPDASGRGVAVDAAGDVIVAGGLSDSISVYPPGSTTPSRTIIGPDTLLLGPIAVAVDAGGTIYVGTAGNTQVLEFAPGASGDAKPAVLNVAFPTGSFESVGGLAIGPAQSTASVMARARR